MSATTVLTPLSTTTRAKRSGRARAVAIAVIAPTLLYVVGDAAGVEFTITDPGDTVADAHHFVATEIAMISLILALVGWGVLALLEHFSRRAATIWTVLATLVFVASLAPIWIETATSGTRFMLVLVHLAVAAPLIAWLPRRTAR